MKTQQKRGLWTLLAICIFLMIAVQLFTLLFTDLGFVAFSYFAVAFLPFISWPSNYAHICRVIIAIVLMIVSLFVIKLCLEAGYCSLMLKTAGPTLLYLVAMVFYIVGVVFGSVFVKFKHNRAEGIYRPFKDRRSVR